MKPTKNTDYIFNKSEQESSDQFVQTSTSWTKTDTFQVMRFFILAFVILFILGFILDKYFL